MTKAEIKTKIEEEITGYELLLKNSELAFREKRIYKQNLGILKKLLRFQELKVSERKTKEEFCKETSCTRASQEISRRLRRLSFLRSTSKTLV